MSASNLRVVLASAVFAVYWSPSRAQPAPSYHRTDSLIAAYSERSGRSADSLIRFVKVNFSSDEQMVRAFYTWIALNITYDKSLLDDYKVGSSLMLQQYRPGGSGQEVDTVLLRGRAVCEGNCQLMNFFCEKTGITSLMVPGITRVPEGEVAEKVLHTWNVVKVDSAWRLLDVTWAAGYVNGRDEYIKRFTGTYFFTPPEIFGNTHWPLDVMFQLQTAPLKKEGFYMSSSIRYFGIFSFGDSISDFLRLGKAEREYAALMHYHRYDPDNRVYRDGLDHFSYNRAATLFNKAALYFDDYYDYAKTLKGRQVGLAEVKRCLRLLAEPKKQLEQGLVYARGRQFFSQEVKKRFDQMVQSSSKKLVQVNSLVESYEKMQGSLR